MGEAKKQQLPAPSDTGLVVRLTGLAAEAEFWQRARRIQNQAAEIRGGILLHVMAEAYTGQQRGDQAANEQGVELRSTHKSGRWIGQKEQIIITYAPFAGIPMAELQELSTLLSTPRDLIRWAASQFQQADLCYGHGTETALDEAASLVLQCLKLPHDLPAVYFDAVLTNEERLKVLGWIVRRRDERLPLPYITGRAWFAGMEFIADKRALVPRSPIAEFVAQGFAPWLTESPERILDLCTGGGSIAIACAHVFDPCPVDAADLSADALAQARENVELHSLTGQIELLEGDLFAPCAGRVYDVIVSNPPYVSASEYASLPAEFAHEPRGALEAPEQGLQLVYKMLQQAPDYLRPGGLLICEVGATAAALMAARPELPLHWPEFENGGDGVFIVSREALLEAGEQHVG